eukprot:1154945-Pelagomonas_calceolata.AAC.1
MAYITASALRQRVCIRAAWISCSHDYPQDILFGYLFSSLENKYQNKKILDSFSWRLLPHAIEVRQRLTMLSRGSRRMGTCQPRGNGLSLGI